MASKTIKVLSIEDELGDAQLIQTMLTKARGLAWDLPHLELEWAQTLADGLARLDEGGIDVVLSDLDLPDSRADDTFATLHAHAPDVPIVVLTGRENPELARQTVRAGAEDYLFKREMSGSLLAHALIYAIERQQTKRALRQAHDELERRVTERTAELEQANEQLRESERRYRELFENSRDGFVFVDVEGRFIDANQAYCQMLGYTLAELQQKADFYEITPPSWRDWEQEEIWEKRLLQEGYSGVYEKEYIRKDGTVFPVELQSYTVFDEQDEPRYLWGVARDITQYKHVEQSLKKSVAAFNASQAMAHLGSWELDLAANRLTWSDEVYRIFGLRPHEFDGTYEAFLDAVHPDDRAAVDGAYSESLREGRDTYEIEHRIVRRDSGAVRIVHEKCEHVRDDAGRIVRSVGMVQDVTERVQAKEKISHYATELKRSNQELEQFAQVVSHDLREPLRMVKSYLELVQDRCQGQLDAEINEFIGYALDGAVRMQGMIRALLDLTQVHTRSRKLVSVDCETLLARTLATYNIAIEESGAQITHDPLPTVLADEGQLAQVFQNLIDNAIKFQGDESPRIHVSARREGDEWLFAVKDNGIGLDPAQAGRIFEIFQRLHTKDEYEGAGIGLALCQKIVERHGGRIWVESQPGQGSTFYFTITSQTKS